jgi:hypothetical protein
LRSLGFGMRREEYLNYKRPTTGRTIRLALSGSSPVGRNGSVQKGNKEMVKKYEYKFVLVKLRCAARFR